MSEVNLTKEFNLSNQPHDLEWMMVDTRLRQSEAALKLAAHTNRWFLRLTGLGALGPLRERDDCQSAAHRPDPAPYPGRPAPVGRPPPGRYRHRARRDHRHRRSVGFPRPQGRGPGFEDRERPSRWLNNAPPRVMKSKSSHRSRWSPRRPPPTATPPSTARPNRPIAEADPRFSPIQ